ncbi:MAG: oxidoreductase GFO/IDH/MOCA family [Puniceicoccaceae bacterium 5H]|nr:MAG: oxidoreductase GFO/IDH/MOCA family [Puniceicoccaceae bacterium 5H]
MSDPRICIIGCGHLASRKIYPFLGLAGGALVGVCDLDREKAERNARRFGGTPYTDYRQMLDTEQPDGVIVCVGPKVHARLATEMLQRGLPVYTEKPPAENADDALAVARVARQQDRLCMTAFKKRYAVVYQRAAAWLQAHGELQRYSISVDYASATYPAGAHPRPFLLDFAIHTIDLVAYLFGQVEAVSCFAREDHAYAVNLQFANGAVGSMNLTDGRSFQIPTEEIEITLEGGNFMSIHNSSQYRIAEGGKTSEWREPPTFVSAGDSGDETGHGVELRVFVEHLRGTHTGPVPSEIYQSYQTMKLYDAIVQAADTGKTVPIHYEAL